MADQLSEVVCKLHEISGIKFGEFKLKGGVLSPVYFDLRVIISKPKLLDTVSKLLWHVRHPHTIISYKNDVLFHPNSQ